jgi:hypothetical protein
MKIILHRAALFAFSSDPYYNHAHLNGLSGSRLPGKFMAVPLRLHLPGEFRQTCGETLLTTWGLTVIGAASLLKAQPFNAHVVTANTRPLNTAASGPTASDNPGGSGEPIGGAVIYRPYLIDSSGIFVFLPLCLVVNQPAWQIDSRRILTIPHKLTDHSPAFIVPQTNKEDTS